MPGRAAPAPLPGPRCRARDVVTGSWQSSVDTRPQNASRWRAVAATHGLLVGGAAGRLGRLPVRCLVTTDSLPQNHSPAMTLQVESVAPLLADAIGRLHHDQPLAGLLART